MTNYYKFLYDIAAETNGKVNIGGLLPTENNIYSVDLGTKAIKGPEKIGIHKDHRSDVFYFRMNRFFGNKDLTQTTCVIEFINANGEAGVYLVPFFDIYIYSETDEVLFPWCVGSQVTAAPGKIKYSIRFYDIDEPIDPNANKELVYNLGLLETTAIVEDTISVDIDLDDDETIEKYLSGTEYATIGEYVISRVNQIQDRSTYWLDI